MRVRRIGLAAVASLGLLITACDPGADTGAQAPTPTAAASTAAPTPSKVALPDRYDPKRDPAADLKAALALSKADGKPVLIDFGADWCPDCHVLHELFEAEATKPLLDRSYHLLAVDVGEFDHNLEFAAKYINLKRSGIPALVVLNTNGTVRVATNDGSFANARNMKAKEVNAFLARWAMQR